MSMKTNPCKTCNSPFHTAMYHKRQPLKAKTGFAKTKTVALKTKKPMNKIGKVQKRTAAAVAKWKRTQKPNHDLTYNCYICNKPVHYLMAEHVKSKVRRPDLRTDPKNLKPVCAGCNEKKGSKNL